jgi:hypothetical protein
MYASVLQVVYLRVFQRKFCMHSSKIRIKLHTFWISIPGEMSHAPTALSPLRVLLCEKSVGFGVEAKRKISSPAGNGIPAVQSVANTVTGHG